jgi:hypothetical protein
METRNRSLKKATKKLAKKAARKDSPLIADSPARQGDRGPLFLRGYYDLSDYGIHLSHSVESAFEVVPSLMTDEELFLFFFSREDIASNRYALFNLHAFLKRSGSLEDFARSLGESVRHVLLKKTHVLGISGLTYSRRIKMKDLFSGAEHIIDFIGGTPDLEVRDSHTYFQHRHNHYYIGMLHADRQNLRYDRLRSQIYSAIQLV